MPHVIPPAASARRIVIVGAGPGGLEAARVAGERGHDVILLEAMPWAGGQLNLAARNPRRKDLQGIVEWRVNELKRLGVDVRYDTFADADLVASLHPVVVIEVDGLEWMAVAGKEVFYTQRPGTVSGAEQHRITVTSADQFCAPQDERAHNDIANLGVRLQESQQLLSFNGDRFAVLDDPDPHE
jgi:pyruvate/2-oxoglutarate dehydrogenase complex dihydrolipoamide dehydrogenase (E3) component